MTRPVCQSGARKRAGLTHGTCHQLRHTCLTRLREAGMALEAVQAQAGHRSIESTRVYLHLTNDWLAREYRRASDLIEAGHAAELIATHSHLATGPHLSPALGERRQANAST